MKRLPLKHLLAIFAALAVLAAVAWFYTNAQEPVEGLPSVGIAAEQQMQPASKDACESAGGVWNECASACPPHAEACILMCVQKCEGLGDGEAVVSVYFPNTKLDPQHLDCSVVFPSRRAVLSGDVAKAALEALLQGPTDDEKTSGAFTSLPEDVELRPLVVKNGVATADFSSSLNRVAGSCRVGSIRAQVEKTLLAVDGVQAVVITVNGKTEDVLQP